MSCGNCCNSIPIDLVGADTTTVSNVGTGAGTIGVVGSNIQLKTIESSDASIGIVNNANTIDITSSGEANTASNVGTGDGALFKAKVSSDLQFKTLKDGTGIDVVNGADEVTVNLNANLDDLNNVTSDNIFGGDRLTIMVADPLPNTTYSTDVLPVTDSTTVQGGYNRLNWNGGIGNWGIASQVYQQSDSLQTWTRYGQIDFSAASTQWQDYAFGDAGPQYTELTFEPDKTYSVYVTGLVSALQTEVGAFRLWDSVNNEGYSIKGGDSPISGDELNDPFVVITPILQNVQSGRITVQTNNADSFGDGPAFGTSNRTFRVQLSFQNQFNTGTFQFLEDFGLMAVCEEVENNAGSRRNTVI